jgi:hypothetical protein
MTNSFVNSFQSEWLKRKRSLATWLVLVGAVFVPSIILASRIKNHATLEKFYAADDFWRVHWNQSWEVMAIILLPLGVVLATSLITQIEYKNNTWKQLHTTPQTLTVVFFAKLAVILTMMTMLFVLFNVAVYLSAILPPLIFSNISMPQAPMPFETFLKANFNFFVDCLPILALQYLISLQFKNFMIPIGVGLIVWVLSIGMLSWDYSFLIPYAYCSLDFVSQPGQKFPREFPVNLQILAFGYFLIFIFVGYILYLTKKEKG